MGVKVEKHHHEVAQVNMNLECILALLLIKLIMFNSTNTPFKWLHSFGKTAAFMPKPVKGDNGSGTVINQFGKVVHYLWVKSMLVFLKKLYTTLEVF